MLGDLSGHSGEKNSFPIKFNCVITKKKTKPNHSEPVMLDPLSPAITNMPGYLVTTSS